MAVPLRQGYDIGERVADDPIVWVVDDFVSELERSHIVELGVGNMDVALVSRLGENAASEQRTGRVGWVAHDATPTVRSLVRRVGDLVGFPVTHAESLQVVHYGPTQEYRPHFDAWDRATPKGRQKTARGGNRAVTALMYLNDVEAGGATIFPELGIEVDAVPGRLCLFHNLREDDGGRHPGALHGGMPVIAGEKWACNLWFREQRYRRGAATSGRTTSAGAGPARRKKRR